MREFKPQKVSRTDRLNSELKKELYEIITRKLKNPLITAMVSIIKVDVSPDLKHAKVLVSIYSTDREKMKSTFDAITADSKRIRYELGQSMRIRTVPELQFVLDDSMEYSARISDILDKIGKQN